MTTLVMLNDVSISTRWRDMPVLELEGIDTYKICFYLNICTREHAKDVGCSSIPRLRRA